MFYVHTLPSSVFSIGARSTASGTNSIAIGNNDTTSKYDNAVAIGNSPSVGFDNSIILGNGAQNVDIGTSNTLEILYISSAGDARIILEVDIDNITETDNPMIELWQDGGLVKSVFGNASGSNSLTVATANDNIHFATYNT